MNKKKGNQTKKIIKKNWILCIIKWDERKKEIILIFWPPHQFSLIYENDDDDTDDDEDMMRYKGIVAFASSGVGSVGGCGREGGRWTMGLYDEYFFIIMSLPEPVKCFNFFLSI